MRKTLLTVAATTAVLALGASPASAGSPGGQSYAKSYSSAYTSWSGDKGLPGVTHSESAARTGLLHAEAAAPGVRPAGWAAIGAGFASQTLVAAANPYGYKVDVSFTGISASSTGRATYEPPFVTGPAADTVATVSVGVRLAGQCTTAVPCKTVNRVVDGQGGSPTAAVVTYYFGRVDAKSTMVVNATADAWLRTPDGDTAPAAARVTAQVASITVTPLTAATAHAPSF